MTGSDSMNGQENLIPFNKMTEEQQREIARKGGIASQKKAKERKTLREELILLLSTNDNNNKISVALLNKALNGDIQAFTTIRDTIGEKPIDKNVNVEVDKLEDLL